MKKIGILGGTFDPIHNGHISLAQDAQEQANLDQVLFVPAKLQPFKLHKQVTNSKHRMAMVCLAIEKHTGFSASSIELDLPEISYTCNTMKRLQMNVFPGDKLFFITGTDAFLKINKWKHAEELLKNYSFIVGSRPGYREAELQMCIEQMQAVYNTSVVNINNRKLDISATKIRELVNDHKSLSMYVPAAVERYITENGLY